MAAGLGTRMNSSRAKVLHQLDGRPLISHVCRMALALNPRAIYIIVGHQAEEVRAAVEREFDPDTHHIAFVHQREQRGTGDAVMAAREHTARQASALCSFSGC